jgi:hypothetical protein
VRSHFWPFTDVQNGNQLEVMRKMWETLDYTDFADERVLKSIRRHAD